MTSNAAQNTGFQADERSTEADAAARMLADIKKRRQRKDKPVYADHTLQADIDWLITQLEAGFRAGEGRQHDAPEGCNLIAHDTGDGWYLGVEDSKGNTVAMLEWPRAWPEGASAKWLREIGFEVS